MDKTFIHMSDLHIGKKGAYAQRWECMVDHIARYHEGVPVFITGDITDSGTEEQLADARDLLTDLASTNPVLTVPGNHDYAWKGFLPFHSPGTNLRKWYEYCGQPLGFGHRVLPNYWMKNPDHIMFEGYGCLQIDDYTMAFYVDSGDPDRKARCARGWISPLMCEILQEELTRYQSYTRIVFLHHHPFNRAYMTSLEGATQFLYTLESAGCELLLFGHKHRYGQWYDGLYRPPHIIEDHETATIPCVVASHSSVRRLSGSYGGITVIDATEIGTKDVQFTPRVEMVDFGTY
jgi:3',5'-cyclic AMP phosphodiesterase CpdA